MTWGGTSEISKVESRRKPRVIWITVARHSWIFEIKKLLLQKKQFNTSHPSSKPKTADING